MGSFLGFRCCRPTAFVVFALFVFVITHNISSCLAEVGLKVGVITPLSGSAAAYGKAVRNGLELAREDIPDASVSLIYEDDGFKPANSVRAFKKLVEIDRVKIVIVTASAPTNAVAELAQKASVPLIAWASDNHETRGKSFVVRSWMSGAEEGKQAAAEALHRGYKAIGAIFTTNDYPLSVRDGIRQGFAEPGLLLDEEMGPDAQDYKPLLLKARSRQIRALFLCLNPGGNALLAKQARQLNYQPSLFACENFNSADEIEQADGTLLNAWFVTAGANPEFQSRYIKRFKEDDLISGAAIHYDIFKLLYEYSRTAPSANFSDWLIGQKSQSAAIGSFEIVNENGDRYFKIKMVVREISKDGIIDAGKSDKT